MFAKFPFCYEINSGTLALATGSSTINQIFSSTKDFRLRFIRATGNTGVKVQVSEVSGNNFSNAPVTTALIGNASNNGIALMDTIIIPKGTQLRFAFSNTDTSAHTEVVQLWGEELE